MRLQRLRWLILGLLFLSTTINYLDRQALSVLLPTLRADLGLTSADYGAITMVFMLAYTVAQLGAGMVIDRIGVRRSFSYFVVGWSLSALAHAFARGAMSLGVFRCLLALSEAGNWPAGAKAVARWFPAQRRGMAMAVFDSGAALGAVLAPPLVALLALQFGWRAAFAGTAVIEFAWLIGWLKVYDEPEESLALARRHPLLMARIYFPEWVTSDTPDFHWELVTGYMNFERYAVAAPVYVIVRPSAFLPARARPAPAFGPMPAFQGRAVLRPAPPSLPAHTPLADAMPDLVKHNAVLVNDGGRVVGILTKIDVLDFIQR